MTERRYGVLIASSQYQDQKLQNLRCPESDVDGFNEVLVSKEYGSFAETFVLKNRPHHEVLLKINQVLKKARKDDLVLIYYSGHGKLNAAGKLHLATTDTIVDSLEATSIPVETLKSYIDISPANKFIFILDSCFSGAAGDAFTKGCVDDQLHLASGGRGTYIMAGSTGIQTALEKESDNFGVFTKHIIQGIKSGEAADDDGLVTMDGLYSYVHDKVLEESSQEPMKWDLNVRGDLVIASSGRSKRSERSSHIREMLFDLASKKILPDRIFTEALQVIEKKNVALTLREKKYSKLLDNFFEKKIEINKFIDEWYKIEHDRINESGKTRNDTIGEMHKGFGQKKIDSKVERLIIKIGANRLITLQIFGSWIVFLIMYLLNYTSNLRIGMITSISYDSDSYNKWADLENFLIFISVCGMFLLLSNGLLLGWISYRRKILAGMLIGWAIFPFMILVSYFSNNITISSDDLTIPLSFAILTTTLGIYILIKHQLDSYT